MSTKVVHAGPAGFPARIYIPCPEIAGYRADIVSGGYWLPHPQFVTVTASYPELEEPVWFIEFTSTQDNGRVDVWIMCAYGGSEPPAP